MENNGKNRGKRRNEEMEKDISEQTGNHKQFPWKKSGRIAAFVLGGVLLFVLLIISFLQFNTFRVKPQTGHGLTSYFAEQDIPEKVTAQEGAFHLNIPDANINEELIRQTLEKEENIHNMEFDIASGKAMINYKVGGFYLPVMFAMQPDQESAEIRYKMKVKSLGRIGIPISGWLFARLQGILQTSLQQGIGISAETFSKHGWESLSWKATENMVEVKMTLAGEALDEIAMELKSLPENEVKYIFEEGNDRQKNIVRLIAGYPNTKEELKKVLVDTYFTNDPMFEKFLLLMNAELMEKTFSAYPFIKGKYELNTSLKKRSDLIAESISSYGKEILKATRDWMDASGGEFYNNGYPYLKKSMRTVTIKDVIETWSLPISESLSSRIHFGLDMADNQLAVVYIVDSGSYAVIKEDGYLVVDEKTYEARYHRAVPEIGDFTADPEIWTAITDKLRASFKTEQLFVRYMKDDGKDAFVLTSFLEKPQDVQAISFSKIDGEWQPTASNFKDINELQAQDSGFNLNLYTDSYEDPKLIYIDEDAYANIVEELSYANKLPEGEKPVYYSYKGKYIYVKLSGGAEYLLTTYHQYLDKIYTRESAEEIFADALPQIILLQKSPLEAEEAKKEKEAEEKSEAEPAPEGQSN